MDVPLRCTCGMLRGWLRSVTPRVGNRLICYCDDCQSFAYFLGRADAILDRHGGTDVFQTSPARLEITEGVQHLACVQLRPGSRIVRWYTGCCRTPIGNAPAARGMPFVGVIRSCMDIAATGRSADAVLGPVRGSVFGRFARGDPAELPRPLPVLQILRLARTILAARLRRDHLRSPLRAPDGEPRAVPRVLGAEELGAVEAARDAAAAEGARSPKP